MLSSLVLIVLLVIELIVIVQGQYVESPCPGIFDYKYKTDGRGVYGYIRLRNTGHVSTLQVRANFTIAARLSSNYVGHIGTVNMNSNLLNFNQGVPLEYRVDFPITSPLPRLTSLAANDNVLCYGPPDIPSPSQYVTTISLQHTLFLMSQPGSGNFNYHEPTQQTIQHNFNQHDPPQQTTQQKPNIDLDFFSNLPEDAQIFTLTESGNRHQLEPVSRPQFDQSLLPITRPPNRRPETPPIQYYPETANQPQTPPPQYYPEVVTQSPPLTRPPQPAAPTTQTPVRPQDIVSSITTSVQCGVVAGGNDRQPLIFNGQSYSRGEWPWVVALYKRKDGSLSFICSGTLVSDRHVVSAAHCMHVKNSITSKKDIVVKVGVYNLEDWGDDITVTRTLLSATIHEQYNSTSLANDILVLTLERSVEFNTNIRPACLWSGNPDLSRIVGASGVVAGWGQSEKGPEGQGEPRIARIPIVSTAACRASKPDFHKLTSEYTLCAGDRNGVGPCLGDSGGGFYLLEGGRWQLRGVVSLSLRPDNGDHTCNLNEYVVFTDAAKYIDWIRSIIGR